MCPGSSPTEGTPNWSMVRSTLLVEVPELFTVSNLSWTIFHAVKAFAI